MPSYNSRRPGGRRPNSVGRQSFGGNRRNNNKGGAKQFIHPSRFVQAAQPVDVVQYEPANMFEDFALHQLLKDNIAKKGFTAPSQIQDEAIPHALQGRDVIGIANTGTGKTTAFALPILNSIMADKNTRALIMAPTRELAMQIEDECRSFGKGTGTTGTLVIGGASMSHQIRDLKMRPNIVIGTPGRLKDHVQRGTLKLNDFSIVVLDEVDRMLDMGFINDIRFLLGQVAPIRQSLFFSATMDPKIQSLIEGFTNTPITVSVRTSETSANVEQDVVRYKELTEKLDKLHKILDQEGAIKAIVFDETKWNVERLSKALYTRGFSVDALHGGKSQGQRKRALDRFRKNDINILVATDVAARGIDVADITHVINYTTPKTYDDYTHRIGRAGRAGRKGHALTFVAE